MNHEILKKVIECNTALRGNPSKENEQQAKEVLLDLLVALKRETPDPYVPCQRNDEGLVHMWNTASAFMDIAEERYIQACESVYKAFMGEFCGQSKWFDAIIPLLETIPGAKEYTKMKNAEYDQQFEFSRTRKSLYSRGPLRNASVDRQIGYIQYAIDVVRRNIESEIPLDFFRRDSATDFDDIIPLGDFDVGVSETESEIPFEGNSIIAVPWDANRLVNAVADIDRVGYKRPENDKVTGLYYPEIRTGLIVDGRHHSSVASVKREDGSFWADVYELTPAFDWLRTDGAFWYGKGKRISVSDYRFALLYSLARDAHGLQNGVSLETVWKRDPKV